jgi:hypothetical protein
MSHEENIAELHTLLKEANVWLHDQDFSIQHLSPTITNATFALACIECSEYTLWLNFEGWQLRNIGLDGRTIKIEFVKYHTA